MRECMLANHHTLLVERHAVAELTAHCVKQFGLVLDRFGTNHAQQRSVGTQDLVGGRTRGGREVTTSMRLVERLWRTETRDGQEKLRESIRTFFCMPERLAAGMAADMAECECVFGTSEIEALEMQRGEAMSTVVACGFASCFQLSAQLRRVFHKSLRADPSRKVECRALALARERARVRVLANAARIHALGTVKCTNCVTL
jgi:hypothetical protein